MASPQNLKNVISIEKSKISIKLSYVLIMLVFYGTSLLFARYSAMDWIKSDMQQKLDLFLISVDADFDRKVWFANSLTENASITKPLLFNMEAQLKEYLKENEALSGGIYKLILTNKDKKIIFNNTDNFNDLTSIPMDSTSYSCYVNSGRIYYVNYKPVEFMDLSGGNVEMRLGAIISAYDFLDFYKLVPKSDKKLGYTYYGFADYKLLFRIDGRSVYENRRLNAKSLYKFKPGFVNLKIDGDNVLVLLKQLPVENSKAPFFISIAISSRQLEGIMFSYTVRSFLYCTFAAVIITLIMIYVYYLLRKDYMNKLEIRGLRTQRHDFSKHLGIIRGITALGDLDELKIYLDCLGEKISIEGELSKIGCPPLEILIQEKEATAKENDIDFKINIFSSIGDIRMNPDDLCVVMGNIVENAIDAVLEGTSETKFIALEISRSGGYYCFKVSNSGNILSVKQVQNIFKPGYSTKAGSGKGRGMGLYIVSRTLRKYRGSIQVDSDEEMTAFKIFVPAGK